MAEEEDLKAILREAFGGSSSSSESDGEPPNDQRRRLELAKPQPISGNTHIWEPITQINGLSICREFLNSDQQYSLLSSLQKEGYLDEDSHNQAMRFGDLPPWALELSYNIREDVLLSGYFSDSLDKMTSDSNKETCLFPSQLLCREPLFNQLIVNIYQPGNLCTC